MPLPEGQGSAPAWFSFTCEDTGCKVHINVVLFRTLQPGRHLGYLREVLVVEPEPQVIDLPTITDETDDEGDSA